VLLRRRGAFTRVLVDGCVTGDLPQAGDSFQALSYFTALTVRVRCVARLVVLLLFAVLVVAW
jgi:hypothetical protein